MSRSKKCVHYWIVETAHGKPTSLGSCQKCGESKEFKNYIDTRNYEHREQGAAKKSGND